ncbi:hypothetical protein N7474_000501 [Penicillium riverlandense]|uniref:uncharacterized protein n=1 Tax=Penicillium riverlandense TaxID=1903569 RepID=UPI0025493B99|nr:uncharacterized protein N7474_000501 [Penicillium riverlandense]KAJ5832190.1 hypothetical protein N7474_000501 [Penicillium riverlandense]
MRFRSSILAIGLLAGLGLSQTISITTSASTTTTISPYGPTESVKSFCVFGADQVQGCTGVTPAFADLGDDSQCGDPYKTDLPICGIQSDGTPVAGIKIDLDTHEVTYMDIQNLDSVDPVFCTMGDWAEGAMCVATSSWGESSTTTATTKSTLTRAPSAPVTPTSHPIYRFDGPV